MKGVANYLYTLHTQNQYNNMMDTLYIRFIRGEGSNRRNEQAKSSISIMNVIKRKGEHIGFDWMHNLVMMLSTFGNVVKGGHGNTLFM